MAISTNPKPTFYRNLYENTSPDFTTRLVVKANSTIVKKLDASRVNGISEDIIDRISHSFWRRK